MAATFRNVTSAALLMGAAFACGPAETAPDTDSEVIDKAKSGILKLDHLPNGSSLQRRITASFIDAPSDSMCTVKESGPCRLIDCASGRAGLRSKDAGDLTFTDESTKESVPMFFTGTRGYDGGAVVTGTLFQAGKEVSAAGAGASVPAFKMTLKAPSPVTVTAPTDATLSIDRSKDLALTWEGDSEGKFVFQLMGQATSLPVFECRFDARAKSGTVPSAALQLLSAGTFQADAFNRTRLVRTVDEWPISVDVRYYAGTNGNAYKRSASVQ